MKELLGIFIFLIMASLAYCQNKVADLELPPNTVVEASKKTITVDGKCQGLIKWLVTSDIPTKYTVNESKNSVTINLPESGNINVIALGIINGKATDFAITNIKIKGEDKKLPIVEKTQSSVYVFADIKNISQEKLNLFDTLYQNKNIKFLLNDLSSPLLLQTKYSEIYQSLNQKSLLLVEDSTGKIIYAQPLPQDTQSILEILKQYS